MQMSNLTWTGLLAVGLTFGVSAPALSHHSHAMFGHAVEIAVTGTVTDFSYHNPGDPLYWDAIDPRPWGTSLNQSDERYEQYLRAGGTPAGQGR